MVSGYTTEYSGIKFALFYLAEYVHLFGISVLASIVFFGGPNGPIFNSNILIAELLLNQSFFCGIGNYIRSEILYEANNLIKKIKYLITIFLFFIPTQ